MLFYAVTLILCVLLWKLMSSLKSSWSSYSAIIKALSRLPLSDQHHWFYGIAHVAKDSETYLNTCTKDVEQYHHRLMAVWLTWLRPSIFVVHPSSMKAILQASHLSAPKSDEYRFFQPWIGDGVLVSSERKWERNRRLLTPGFHFDILKPYVHKYNEVADILLSKLSRLGTGCDSIDICPLINRATLDTLLRCALSYEDEGIQSTDGKEHPYCHAVGQMKESLVWRVLHPLFHNDFLFNLTSHGKKLAKGSDYVHTFSSKWIQQRQTSIEKDPSQLKKRHLDFLDILLTARDENGKGLKDKEIQDEVDTFVFAGHDTTASAIMWTLHKLGKYPSMQTQVRKEVEAIMCGRDALEYEDLSKLHYTTCFIKESLRVVPPVPAFTRKLTEPVVFEGVTIPANTIVDVSPWCLHRHPDVWKEPNVFNPDRFLPDNIAKKDPFAFVPFSAGPRNCIGQHFAMNEIKVLISRIVKQFEISLDKNREAIPFKEVITAAKDGIYLHFRDLGSNKNQRPSQRSEWNTSTQINI